MKFVCEPIKHTTTIDTTIPPQLIGIIQPATKVDRKYTATPIIKVYNADKTVFIFSKKFYK